MWVSCDAIFEFWDPPYISRKVEAWNFKFSTETDGSEFLQNKFKIGLKKVMWGSRDPIVDFWDPPNISQTVEARNIKFGMETDSGEF